jgi:hypothetical protein
MEMEVHQMSRELTTHLRDHVEEWPASKNDIMAACHNTADIREEERSWVIENLPDGVYKSPKEVEFILLRGSGQG